MCDNDIARLFAPELAGFITELIAGGRIGLCKGLIRLADVNTGCSSTASVTLEQNMDRFNIVIPYAGCSVTWEILFNCKFPEAPPDFIFSPQDDTFQPDLDNLQNLVNWKHNDSQCLLRVLNDLLLEYKSHHNELLKQHSRLTFEYDSLIKELELSCDDIEVHLTQKERRVGPVKFLIKLPVDFSRIPPYMTKDCPGEDTAVLLVTFQTAECMKAMPELYLSPRVEHVLGGASAMRIPSMTPGSCLLDYIPTVQELLEKKIEQVVLGYEKRRDYVSAALAMFGKSVVEFDAESFMQVNFLMEWNDFFFNLQICLPYQFPAVAPTLTFSSVYHETEGGKPYTRSDKNYPYSPRWTASQMMDRLKAHLIVSVQTFQKDSVKEGTLKQ